MSKTVLKSSIRYFDLLLEEMRAEWRAGTKDQRVRIEAKAMFVTALRQDAWTRLERLVAA